MEKQIEKSTTQNIMVGVWCMPLLHDVYEEAVSINALKVYVLALVKAQPSHFTLKFRERLIALVFR